MKLLQRVPGDSQLVSMLAVAGYISWRNLVTKQTQKESGLRPWGIICPNSLLDLRALQLGRLISNASSQVDDGIDLVCIWRMLPSHGRTTVITWIATECKMILSSSVNSATTSLMADRWTTICIRWWDGSSEDSFHCSEKEPLTGPTRWRSSTSSFLTSSCDYHAQLSISGFSMHTLIGMKTVFWDWG